MESEAKLWLGWLILSLPEVLEKIELDLGTSFFLSEDTFMVQVQQRENTYAPDTLKTLIILLNIMCFSYL